jgi:kynureninase
MPVDDDVLSKWRDEFPILAKKTHLISHSLGAMPRKAREHVGEYLRLWDEQGIVAWNTWLPYLEQLGGALAEIVDAQAGTIVFGPNVSFWQSVIASCFDFHSMAPKNKVVYTALNFHSVHYVWQEQRRRGARVTVVPSDDGISVPTERVIDAIDGDTILVPISHVFFRSSYLQDVAPIIARAHEVGAHVLLDCYQSTGTVPFSLRRLGVDFATGGSVKWLCGGPGAAYLYVRPDLIRSFRPMSTGWFSHQRPFAFEMAPIDYADSVWRYLGGTPAVPALYAARAGYEIVRAIGVPAIREKSLRQTRGMREQARKRGFRINTPEDDARRGGTICIDFDGAEAATKELLARHVLVDYRPGAGIRASPHFYTADAEIARLFDEIDSIRSIRRA